MLLPSPILVRRAKKRRQDDNTPPGKEPPGCAFVFWLLAALLSLGFAGLFLRG